MNIVEKILKEFGSRFVGVLVLGICLEFGIWDLGFAQEIKDPNVAGAFYPAEPRQLSQMIDGFLAAAPTEATGDIAVLISPHAGYVYSGTVAAYGYKAISGKDYRTVIILAASHYLPFDAISVWPKGKFKTPLGNIPVDEAMARQIIAQFPKARFIPQAFDREHSLEVQLPFLQKTLKDFAIVPIAMGQISLEDCRNLAGVLAKIIDGRRDVLIVASTDMSHFHTAAYAEDMDGKTIACLRNFDLQGLWRDSASDDPRMCGIVPVETAIFYAQEKGMRDLRILRYSHSGKVTTDNQRVVGYLSAVIYASPEVKGDQAMLNLAQKKKLLEIARQSLEGYVKTGRRTQISESDPVLRQNRGAFVTLHKNGELRGCIGRIIADEPLFRVVEEMAIEAGTGDPRFSPVTDGELKDLKFEISALSPLEKITDINRIEVGTHGLIIRKGFNSGLLLPQVATEYGWDRETFLKETCRKAGLPFDAWKQGAEIYIFSAEVFSEDSLK